MSSTAKCRRPRASQRLRLSPCCLPPAQERLEKARFNQNIMNSTLATAQARVDHHARAQLGPVPGSAAPAEDDSDEDEAYDGELAFTERHLPREVCRPVPPGCLLLLLRRRRRSRRCRRCHRLADSRPTLCRTSRSSTLRFT